MVAARFPSILKSRSVNVFSTTADKLVVKDENDSTKQKVLRVKVRTSKFISLRPDFLE